MTKLTVPVLTLACLVVFDLCVALGLGFAERTGRLGTLVEFFDYGRSVPGKLDKWEANPEIRGAMLDAAWLPRVLERSTARFQDETATDGPVIRSYGMSFVNNILKSAVALRPETLWDAHTGPGVPPNYVYTLFQEDRANRRTGDVVVLGLLSSGVPAMAALSNRTWVFEQPAPLTYPIYWPEGDGLRRIDPVITSIAQERGPDRDAQVLKDWQAQLKQHDRFYGPATFGAPITDISPLLRLMRRALAKSHVDDTNAQILTDGTYPYQEVLIRMVRAFAETARADGQVPVVVMVQTRNLSDVDLAPLLRETLEAEAIPYLATTDHVSPRDSSVFIHADGHYTPEVDERFAEHFLDLLDL